MIKESFIKGERLRLFQGGIPIIKRGGYFALSDTADFKPHITLKDTAMHPKAWSDCHFEFGYRSSTKNAVLHIAFGKPFPTALPSCAKTEITVSLSNICFEGARVSGTAPEAGKISVDIKDGILTVSSGDMILKTAITPETLTGYCELYASSGRIEMDSFEIHRSALPPMTEEEHNRRVINYRHKKLDEKDTILDNLEKYITENPDALYPQTADIIIPQRLVDAGKEMKVVFKADSPNMAACITHNCFSPHAVPETVVLSPVETDGWFYAEVAFSFNLPGNTKIQLWTGDRRIVRQVAVLGEGYSAVIPWIGSNTPYVDEILHKYDIPGDYWFGIIGTETPEEYIKKYQNHIKNMHLYGDRLVFTVNGKTLVPLSDVGSLFALDHETQKRGLAQCMRCMKLMNVPVELVASYTPDYYSIGILEEYGVKALTSLVNWQNCDDGDWIINHCGVTSQPYYPATDDFRRNGKNRRIMCFPQGNSSYDRNYSIMAFDGCPSNVSPGQRYFENRVVHHQVQRFYDTFDGYLTDCKNSDELTTITICIEAFRGYADWSLVNELALGYMAQKAATEKIVFTSAADVADYHTSRNLPLQKAYFYQPDYYYGYHNADLPGHIPDRMEAETPEYLAVIARGETLPKYFYDYTKPWENREDNLPRTIFGVIPPETSDHTTAVPPQALRHDITINNTLEGNRITVRVSSETPKNRMVTGVFDIPYEKDFTIISEKAVCTKVYDCFTGNTHLFIDLGEIPAGESEFVITLDGAPRTPLKNESVKDLFGAKWFGAHAYLRSTRRDTAVYVEMSAPHSAYIIGQDGIRITAENGVLRFTVNTGWSDEAPLLYGFPQAEFDLSLEKATVKNIGKTTCYPWSWPDWT